MSCCPLRKRFTTEQGGLRWPAWASPMGLRRARKTGSRRRSWPKRCSGVAMLNLPVWEQPLQHPVILLTRTGPNDPLPVPNEQPGPQSRESFQLKVTAAGAEIRGRSSAALFYAVQTLWQLVEWEGGQAFLPEVQIEDWPALAYRGPLWDVGSEGAMSTVEEILRQIDFLAKWKANQYYFYSEASIELDGYPLLNPGARFTKDQIRRIVTYAGQRHIDVVPCLEFYGHLHDLFRIEKYSDLADFPHGGEFDPRNPRLAGLLQDWVDQYVRLFPSQFVHIGFDETWHIEKAARLQGSGSSPAQLFVEQLSNVARLFQQHNKQVLAWADIMVKYPDIIVHLPPGIIAGAWYYTAAPDPEYKRWLDPLVAKKVPHFVQSGVHSWIEVTRTSIPRSRISTPCSPHGRKSGARGFLNSVWTDSGQNLIRQSWPGIAYGIIAAWQSDPMQPFVLLYRLRAPDDAGGHSPRSGPGPDRSEPGRGRRCRRHSVGQPCRACGTTRLMRVFSRRPGRIAKTCGKRGSWPKTPQSTWPRSYPRAMRTA